MTEQQSPGVQGLAQLGLNAIDRVSELERGIAERDETIRKLRDPVAVHVAMLRGEIAVPPLAELLHVYGATFSDLDAANIEIAKARETLRQLRAGGAVTAARRLARKLNGVDAALTKAGEV